MNKGKIFVCCILVFALVLAVFAFGLSGLKTYVAVKRPVNFPVPKDTGVKLSVEAITLGQKLFNDALLSKNGKIACASCHRQSDGYSSAGVKINRGVNEKELGIYNTPALMNLQWKHSYFRDGRTSKLTNTALNAIQSPVEMGESMEHVVSKLNQSPIYKQHFLTVFGVKHITEANLTAAIEQYLLSLVSANSRYDKLMVQHQNTFTPDEAEGLKLFKQKCTTCHSSDLFSDESLRNIGTTRTDELVKRFKVPSLRNVEVTGPYFHDGRFNTLEEVLGYYASGVKKEADLDPALQHDGQAGIALSKDEQRKIILFLKTLTDHAFINKITLQ